MPERFDNSCSSCQAIQGLITLTNTPRILETRHWVVEHVHSTAIKGWLVVVLNRHCHALHQLTAEEFEGAKYKRVAYIKHLLSTGRLDETLRFRM